MRKDLILVAALGALVVSNVIAGEVTSSSDGATRAVPDFRGETSGTLGARGTIGQDATGFTGQERIGTLPLDSLGFRKTNDFDKDFERANEEIKERERSGEPPLFDPTGVGDPATSETGRASQLDPASKVNAPDTIIKDSQTTPPAKPSGAPVSPTDSGPAGIVGSARQYNEPVTPSSQSSAVIGKEDSTVAAEQAKSKQPSRAQGAPGSSVSGAGATADTKATGPTDSSGLKQASGAVQANNSAEDRQMSARLRSQLLNATVPSGSSKLTPRQLRHVQVKASNNGEVTLSGTVSTKEEKRQIESIVKEMRGVSSVNNQLTLKGADGKTDNLPEPSR